MRPGNPAGLFGPLHHAAHPHRARGIRVCSPLFVLALTASATLTATCGPAQQQTVQAVAPVQTEALEKAGAAVSPPPSDVGPRFEVSYSFMAEVLHAAEGISVWRRDLPRAWYRAFDDRFGLDDADRRLSKRFAFARHQLWKKDAAGQLKPTFAKPFGPEGLFPRAEPGWQARFWLRVLATKEPAALRRGLTGILEPSDAEATAGFLGRIAPRVGEIISELGGLRKQAQRLQRLLGSDRLPELLDALGRFAGVRTRELTFRVHPVWLPEGLIAEAVAYGDTIVLPIPTGQAVGGDQVAQVFRAVVERILARVAASTKSLATVRFIEKGGFRGGQFALVEMLMDAAGYGLAAPLIASSAAEVPPWPGEEARKRSAEAMTGLLRDWVSAGKRLDGVFALKAAKAHLQVNPARPADYLDGAMVIAHDKALEPFKRKVTRWAVWKFPLSGKYNYPRKLDDAPGRTVLCILTPRDLKELPARLPGRNKILRAFAKASEALKANQGVIVTVARESRGYIFVVAASGPKAMQRTAESFFELEEIPSRVVEVE